jgi:hypothetical protein
MQDRRLEWRENETQPSVSILDLDEMVFIPLLDFPVFIPP